MHKDKLLYLLFYVNQGIRYFKCISLKVEMGNEQFHKCQSKSVEATCYAQSCNFGPCSI